MTTNKIYPTGIVYIDNAKPYPALVLILKTEDGFYDTVSDIKEWTSVNIAFLKLGISNIQFNLYKNRKLLENMPQLIFDTSAKNAISDFLNEVKPTDTFLLTCGYYSIDEEKGRYLALPDMTSEYAFRIDGYIAPIEKKILEYISESNLN